jgi:hypothetical protein
MSVMAVDGEIVVPGERRERRAEAVTDLSEGQVAAIADALSYYERTRFATEALDAEHVLALRTVSALVDQIHYLAAAGGHAQLRMSIAGASALVQAAAAYLDERDTDGYQSPEERDRLAALRLLIEPLIDLVCDLRRTEREPADRLVRRSAPVSP